MEKGFYDVIWVAIYSVSGIYNLQSKLPVLGHDYEFAIHKLLRCSPRTYAGNDSRYKPVCQQQGRAFSSAFVSWKFAVAL
jgi:hypothetical protein